MTRERRQFGEEFFISSGLKSRTGKCKVDNKLKKIIRVLGLPRCKALSTRIHFRLKTNFLSPFSKKIASIRSVFESFSPVHTKTLKRFENGYTTDGACVVSRVCLRWELDHFQGSIV